MSADTQQQGAAITPLPWEVKPYQYRKRGKSFTRPAAIIAPDGHWIAPQVCGHDFSGSSLENAAYIVRACNAFPALVAALERAIVDLEDFADPDGEFKFTPEAAAAMVRKARAALAEAGR